MKKNKLNATLKINVNKFPRINYLIPKTGYLIKSKKKYYRNRDKKINLEIDF
ncbi:hypothetical protein [Candidatus Phytoplasma pyri]|uniref:hypothetical protein n=1 Tax=Candidatus Phytoplasma pyri TaxID=47566 RepID=UPI003983D541